MMKECVREEKKRYDGAQRGALPSTSDWLIFNDCPVLENVIGPNPLTAKVLWIQILQPRKLQQIAILKVGTRDVNF